MAPQHVHSFLVHPSKHDADPPQIAGTGIPRRGSLYNMLSTVFARAESECNIEIVFRCRPNGEQQNDCRDELVAYLENPNVDTGHPLASRLQRITTHRSGLGLLFLMASRDNGIHRAVISRFPADQGVIAEEHAHRLSVEFVERVFMKSAKAYKSALYSSPSLTRGFWDGRAVDLQISGPRELSDYWIREFLVSDLKTTGPAGTKRLAVALRDAIRRAGDADVREELISAASLMRRQDGTSFSVRQLAQRLGLSPEAVGAIETALPRRDLMDQVFQFDTEEFQKHVQYRAVELDNGGTLIAEDAHFNNVFREQVVNQGDRRIRFTTEGRVIDQALRKTR